MSDAYAKKYPKQVKKSLTTPAMRKHVSRPGNHDEDGNPIYFTEQAHRERCDINSILNKYDKNGLITHISKFEAEFGDTTGVEFKAMQDKVSAARSSFARLPSKIRKEFENSPMKLLSFMDDPNNREKAINLGLIKRTWTQETDGLGEHILKGDNVTKPRPPEPETTEIES